MSVSQDIARARGALDIAQADISKAIVNALNIEANHEAGMPIIEGVYDILTQEHPELADMLHEGIQRLRGVKPETADERMAA